MASVGISDTTAPFSVSRALNLSSGGFVLADRCPETDYGHQDPADKYGRQRCVDELHNYKGDAFQYLPYVGLPQPRHDEAQDRRQDGISYRVLLRGRFFRRPCMRSGTLVVSVSVPFLEPEVLLVLGGGAPLLVEDLGGPLLVCIKLFAGTALFAADVLRVAPRAGVAHL
jgi:hypothetical protein